MLGTLDSGLLDSIFVHLEIEDLCRASQTCRRLKGHIQNHQALISLTLNFADRQKLRRLLFKWNKTALPSHFVHVFLSNVLLKKLLQRPNKLRNLHHWRSPKELKQHNPYFQRSLPLQLSPGWPLPPPCSMSEDVPLPHDLSLCDIWHLLMIHRESLENVSLDTYDSPPLAWSCTPSRTCPRDLIGSKCPDHQPPALYLWCPECKPAKHQHKFCWQLAGETVTSSITEYLGGGLEKYLRAWRDEGDLDFPQLSRLMIGGWASSYILCLLRLMNVRKFPALRELEIKGTVLVNPSMTQDKNHLPRPQLERGIVGTGYKKILGREQKHEAIGELISLHSNPLGKNLENPALSQWWLGLFNGSLWDGDTFPSLKRASFLVGNFDDSCRWLIPLFENCLAKCRNLEIIDLDHSIVQTMRPDDALVRLFSICQTNSDSSLELFPALRIVRIRAVESILELLRIQQLLSGFLGRPIVVQPRKIHLRLASCNIRAEARLLNVWADVQRQHLLHNKCGNLNRDVDEMDLQLFGDDHASMLRLDFDSHVPNVMGFREEQVPRYDARVLTPEDPIYLGRKFAKLSLLYFSPCNPLHLQMWRSLRFEVDPETTIPQYIYNVTMRREAEIDRQLHPLIRYSQPPRAATEQPLPSNLNFLPQSQDLSATLPLAVPLQDIFSIATVPTSNEVDEERENPSEYQRKTCPTLPKKLRRIKIHLEFPDVWQELEIAKQMIAREITALRQVMLESIGFNGSERSRGSDESADSVALFELNEYPQYNNTKHSKKDAIPNNDPYPNLEIRIATCPRLTYGGGANWLWWEEQISGSNRRAPRLSQVLLEDYQDKI